MNKSISFSILLLVLSLNLVFGQKVYTTSNLNLRESTNIEGSIISIIPKMSEVNHVVRIKI